MTRIGRKPDAALGTVLRAADNVHIPGPRAAGELNKKSEVGNFLLSQEAALQVPSADTRLTAGFGM